MLSDRKGKNVIKSCSWLTIVISIVFDRAKKLCQRFLVCEASHTVGPKITAGESQLNEKNNFQRAGYCRILFVHPFPIMATIWATGHKSTRFLSNFGGDSGKAFNCCSENETPPLFCVRFHSVLRTIGSLKTSSKHSKRYQGIVELTLSRLDSMHSRRLSQKVTPKGAAPHTLSCAIYPVYYLHEYLWGSQLKKRCKKCFAKNGGKSLKFDNQ